MSKFADKIIRGEKPNDEDWNEHLREAHAHSPGMTPAAFAHPLTAEGLSSYQILAQSLTPFKNSDAAVLDLACGDGFLCRLMAPMLGPGAKITGVDMSEGELTMARQQSKDPRVQFLCEKAQALPLKDASQDLVVSHLAFMLMLPVEPVVQEIARVLKAGGSFSAVTGNTLLPKGVWGQIRSHMTRFFDQRFPAIKNSRSGDARVNTAAGLRQLFNADTGFRGLPEIQDFEVNVKTSVQGVWDFVKDMYFVDLLPDKDKQDLEWEILSLAENHANDDGAIEFLFPMRKFTVKK